MNATSQSVPTHVNPFAQNLYAYGEDPGQNLLYFILDTSRHEPALKRAAILMKAGPLHIEQSVGRECYDLANELLDVEQIVQKHVALVREIAAESFTDDALLSYVLERLENQPLETKLDVLGDTCVLEKGRDMRIHDSWCNLRKEINRFNQAFETFLFKLRTRYYHESNRQTRAAMIAEEEAAAAAKTGAAGKAA